MKANLPKRISDKWGQGHYGAPRGNHTHHGIDYICLVGQEIISPVNGKVTKLGYPYGDDLSFRYVQISSSGYNHRIFYISPLVEVGDLVAVNQPIGTSQDLGKRYPEITQHIHYEIMVGETYIDPEAV